ncbi:hypothetical protein ACEWY4_026781 [Coilia grayii]|uniref:Arrestin C-terminal-like domain-containing protein n=1 Tax=Coilia grayii TaxID=363190 RepID=A0ABD1IR23_9TELE
MPTVKEFSVSYYTVNQGNTFTSGDYIKGHVVLQLEKEAKIKHLFIKLKGDADVKWTVYSKQAVTYHGHERYFKLKQTFISDDSGETFIVRAEIDNSSSRDLKPKFKLERLITYIVGEKTKTERDIILKEVGSPIPSNHQQTVTKELRIPPSIPPTILFCSILTVVYTLKVYIDVPYAFDPEIKFPMVIIPADRDGPLLSALVLVRLGRERAAQGTNQPAQSGASEAPHHLLIPPDAAQHADQCLPEAHPDPESIHPAVQPSLFSDPAPYSVPAGPVPLQPSETDQQPPPQYDQVIKDQVSTAPLNAASQQPPPQYDQVTDNRVPTAPPLYPTLPAADFLSSPSAPQYVPGAGHDFLSSPSAPQ